MILFLLVCSINKNGTIFKEIKTALFFIQIDYFLFHLFLFIGKVIFFLFFFNFFTLFYDLLNA
jgi:hypothetical protein